MKRRDGWVSLILFLFFLYMTDFFPSLCYLFVDTSKLVEQLINPTIRFDHIDLEKQLLIFHTYQSIANETEVETTTGEPTNPNQKYDRKVYIYSTHQTEKYKDGKTVVDASLELARLLEEKGMKVIVELNDFSKYAKKNGFTYDELYEVSRIYLKEAIEKYGPFDYVIDLHRDGVGSAKTIVKKDNITYAKMMYVVSVAGPYADHHYDHAKQMMQLCNEQISGIGKSINKKYYTIFNQDLQKNAYLIEMGSNTNSYDEVKESLIVFAKALEKRWSQ
ncbi:MAG: stage II sporulation protein P [Erysipelotrichaceae bacterium]|nr:stage II sporulation protein P [Erysipelotrichaceae bacterium]